jgi:hypothetical protein
MNVHHFWPGRGATSRRTKRFALALAFVTAGFALWATGALAVFPDSDAASYAACLNTAGGAAGTFSQVAVGDSPAKACGQNQTLVHLSGGDITAVRTPPGSGLTGGTENGAASLSLASGQSLPQTCSNDQVPKWNGTGWSCGADNDTQPHAWESTGQNVGILSGDAQYTVTSLTLPPGQYVVVSSTELYDADNDYIAGCQMYSGATALGGFYGEHVANEDSNHFHDIALTRTVQFSATTTVKVSCSTPSADGVVAQDASLIATQVGAIN